MGHVGPKNKVLGDLVNPPFLREVEFRVEGAVLDGWWRDFKGEVGGIGSWGCSRKVL